MLLHSWFNEVVRKHGSAKAVVYRDTYLSWRGLAHRVDMRARELAAMGIGKGQWIGLMLGNVPDFAILALALSKLGATVVPLDPTTGARDLAHVVELAQLKGLITRPRGGVDAQPPPAPNGGTRKTPNEPVELRKRLQGTLLTCSIYKRPDEKPQPRAEVVLFTSDSTGEPKGVVRSAANLEAGAESLRAALEVSSEDRILTTVPLHHAYGFDLGLALAVRHGATLYLEDDVAPKRVAKLLRDHEIDLFPATPHIYAGLTQLATVKPIKLRDARYLSSGSALPESVAEGFFKAWGVRILAMYHTTETQTVTIDRRGQAGGTVGKAIDGVEVRVGDATARKTKAAAAQAKAAAGGDPDDGGPVWVRSEAIASDSVGVAPAKAGKPGHVAIGAFDPDGWYRTGDRGRLDKQGRLTLTGREDDLVKVDGKRVALGEVDACLEQFPKVRAAQARLVTDPIGGPMVVASVVAVGKVQAEEIIDHCARNLAPYKVPRRIEFCARLPQ